MKFEPALIKNVDSNWITVPSSLCNIDLYNAIDAYLWCTVQLSTGEFYFNRYEWFFEQEKDALLFVLKWSGE